MKPYFNFQNYSYLMSNNQSDNLNILKAFKSANLFDKVALILSIWFGTGLLPGMPGTFGTAGAIPLYLLTNFLGARYRVLLILIIIIVAIWSSHRSQCILGTDDPKEIVIDEVAGFLLTIIFIPFTLRNLIAGFFLFRFFDILKPPPIKIIEKKVKGGLGVVLDDLVAGLYTYLSLRFLLYMLN
ncbi:MAG: phosphatidylglycerophosphatase A [Deltaproteobacteria bacterium]|nr:MAG: phosphatidylglycerophosphatase A [Deltaproteobacteria bacterium]